MHKAMKEYGMLKYFLKQVACGKQKFKTEEDIEEILDKQQQNLTLGIQNS